ncbi:hypothetical protein SAMN02745171_01449 [Porphyromonas circumdentaria]|uniref:Uncharacterized protein n=1 Tax=Porphyromonas circumdentaria TaxID=29524 RepID=A0A1T4PFM9_9PORP|nr:hypothetical protein [Porphyromonas circumdentaria]SJZ90364.1 hypothetical protein SAMN02745171_01449 [Porphyromonas circumdentaria]
MKLNRIKTTANIQPVKQKKNTLFSNSVLNTLMEMVLTIILLLKARKNLKSLFHILSLRNPLCKNL